MMLSLPNKRQRLLIERAMLPSLTAPKKGEEVLKMTDAAAWMDSWKELVLAINVLSEVRNSVCTAPQSWCPRRTSVVNGCRTG